MHAIFALSVFFLCTSSIALLKFRPPLTVYMVRPLQKPSLLYIVSKRRTALTSAGFLKRLLRLVLLMSTAGQSDLMEVAERIVRAEAHRVPALCLVPPPERRVGGAKRGAGPLRSSRRECLSLP